MVFLFALFLIPDDAGKRARQLEEYRHSIEQRHSSETPTMLRNLSVGNVASLPLLLWLTWLWPAKARLNPSHT